MNIWLDKDDSPHPEITEELEGRNPELFFKATDSTERSLKKALDIMAAIVDKDDCQLDDNGNCLMHTQSAEIPICAQLMAKNFLKDFGINLRRD